MFCSKCGREFDGVSDLCPECEFSDQSAGGFESSETTLITDLEKKANLVNILSIVGLVTAILGCCCGIPGIVCPIIAIVFAVQFGKTDVSAFSADILARYEAAQKTVNRGKIMAIIALVAAPVIMIISMAVGFLSGVLESLMYEFY